jgi:hypothetical protein
LGWPTADEIRGTFKRWTAALRALGVEPTDDVLSRRLTALGAPFSNDEVSAALRGLGCGQVLEDSSGTTTTAYSSAATTAKQPFDPHAPSVPPDAPGEATAEDLDIWRRPRFFV